MPSPRERYHQAIRDARERSLALNERQVEDMLALLEEWLLEMERRVQRGGAVIPDEELRAALEAGIDELVERAAEVVGRGIRTTAEDVAGMQAEAAARLLRDAGRGGLAVGVQSVGLDAAQAVMARAEVTEAMVTLREEAMGRARRLIERGALRTIEPDELAMRLRVLALGADEVPTELLTDRRLIGRRALRELGMEATPEAVEEMRQHAGRIAMRMERIARMEMQQTAHESTVAQARTSPVVRAMQWHLSPRHPEEDICDDLAGTDFYGLGAGVYPPERVPGVPHPNDLCFTTHELLDPSNWGDRPPPPDLSLDPEGVAEDAERSPSQTRMLVRAVDTGLRRVA